MRFLPSSLGLALLLATWQAHAAAPTPPITSGAAAQALYAQWFVPQSAQAIASAQQLQRKLEQYCAGKASLEAARMQFQQASQDWERLSALAMGPQIERRSARMLDFQPMRPALLKSALRKAPKDLAAMETIGAPAKGFPTAEYLLWTDVAQPHTAACTYASLVAADTAQELQTLHQANQQAAALTQLDFDSVGEFINQWVGGVERLRWAAMEKPLRSATATKPAALTRAASQGTLASWQAQWSALRTLAIGEAQQPESVNIARLVQVQGWERLANEVRDAVQSVDTAMQAIHTLDLDSVTPATQALSQLKHLVENDVALALDITIGFSDADGD